jgi:hypothetical protein
MLRPSITACINALVIPDSGELVIQPRFPLRLDRERIPAVNISIHFGRLLAIFLIAGLVLAPLSAPAGAAKAAPMAAEMSADMPCCPDNPAPMDCDQCPLMAICMVQNFQEPSSAGMIELRPVTVRLLVPHSDPAREGLNYLPPPRPPRSLVRSA